jgi:hypothetical protein
LIDLFQPVLHSSLDKQRTGKNRGGGVAFVSTFLRMVFIICITYKENIHAECKPMFRIDHTAKIVYTLVEEWL